MVADLRKFYSAKRVKEGFAYYVCICDHLTQQERQRRERQLRVAAIELNPDAPAPKVLDVNDLAALAERYPGFVLCQPWMPPLTLALSFPSWAENAIGSTPKYIDTDETRRLKARIQEHCAFGEIGDPLLIIRGESGVGKTRLTYEALAATPSTQILAVYTDDERSAAEIASYLVNRSLSAIIVADEITKDGLSRLQRRLEGHSAHIRVIAIEGVEQDYRRVDEGPSWIDNPSDSTIEDIIKANFPDISAERRRSYVFLAENSVRFAIELAKSDREIAVDLRVPRSEFVRRYLLQKLSESERSAVAALSLAYGVGWRDETAQELDSLCEIVGLNSSDVRDAVRRIRDAPGFVATAGRYWYVKPPIVARTSFEDAWGRWAAHNVRDFLERIGASGLLKPFLQQVGKLGTDEVRRQVAGYFRDWAAALDASLLRGGEELNLLIDLVEVEPDTYFPILLSLVDSGSPDDLTVPVPWGADRREARHELVKAARRFANSSNLFHQAESMLLKLASAEQHPIGVYHGEGRRLYSQLFKIYLSGSPLPFGTRLARLQRRMTGGESPIECIAAESLCDIFELHHSRGLDEPLLAGRIPAEDWRPLTGAELIDCYVSATDLAIDSISGMGEEARTVLWNCLLGKLQRFAHLGLSSQLSALFPITILPDNLRRRLANELSAVIDDVKAEETGSESREGSRLPPEQLAALESLMGEVSPTDLGSKLHLLLSQPAWKVHAYEEGSRWRAEAKDVASAVVMADHNFILEVARRGGAVDSDTSSIFGSILGDLDTNSRALVTVLEAIRESGSSALALGYVNGQVRRNTASLETVIDLVNDVNHSEPEVALQVILSAPGFPDAVERIADLVDQGLIPANRLKHLEYRIWDRKLSNEEIGRVLDQLAVEVRRGDSSASELGISMLRTYLRIVAPKDRGDALVIPVDMLEHAWLFAETIDLETSGESADWAETLSSLARIDPERSIPIAARALAAGISSYLESASSALFEAAQIDPNRVMHELGSMMLDSDRSFLFSLHSHVAVIEALPSEIVLGWLDQYPEQAFQLGFHLPQPFLAPDKVPIVPELTEQVLAKYGHIDELVTALARASFSRTRVQAVDVDVMAERHRKVADLARNFRSNSVEGVRRWASRVAQIANYELDWHQLRQQEDEERRVRR